MNRELTRVMLAAYLGWISLLSVFFVAAGVASLLGHTEIWGELGFGGASVLIIFTLSASYLCCIIVVFIPLNYVINTKAHACCGRSLIGALAFGIALPLFDYCSFFFVTGGGSFSQFLRLLRQIGSLMDLLNLISAAAAGAMLFSLAQKR